MAELTPDQLIAVGEVAKKYALYTKITGGRIDLFGAQVEQLPFIWEELIVAGFESGHAYGKSLRTVKSCVGSTWCRYGQQDSVGMAIDIEKRYRGLRSPHKLKMAVSGCTRECAEAQSKGRRHYRYRSRLQPAMSVVMVDAPTSCRFIAEDLDETTLVQYIDRFLMFYIRTADRLQAHLGLDGKPRRRFGLPQKVIIDDSLGLAEQLEADMAFIVDTYQCEWKNSHRNPPEIRQRFTHFVNSDDADDNIEFVDERGQIRPITKAEREAMLASS